MCLLLSNVQSLLLSDMVDLHKKKAESSLQKAMGHNTKLTNPLKFFWDLLFLFSLLLVLSLPGNSTHARGIYVIPLGRIEQSLENPYETGHASFVPRLTVQRPGNETRRKMSWRPWTAAAARLRHLKGHKRKLPEPITKWKIVRGDLVSFRPSLHMQLWQNNNSNWKALRLVSSWSLENCMQVEVLCGKDRGRQGHVAVVARKLNKVIVQGLNTVVWHLPLICCDSCMMQACPQQVTIVCKISTAWMWFWASIRKCMRF